jgi:dolichyl-phosphate-mannose--protein O-mannosyl transferase
MDRVHTWEHTLLFELGHSRLSFPLSSACMYPFRHYPTLLMASIGCFGLGLVLDMKNTSQRRRAQYGMAMVVILNLGVYIWSIVMQSQFQRSSPGKIDWDEDLYARSFLPYFFVQTTGPLSQSYMYWLLSSFATDAQGMYP